MPFNRFIHKTGGTKKVGFSRPRAMQVGSWGPLRAWKILDFELPRHFNAAILASKTSLRSVKIIQNTCETEKIPLLKLIYTDWKTDYTLRSMHNWTHSVDWVIGNYHLLVIFSLGIFEPSNIYPSNFHVFVKTIFMFENSIWKASCTIPAFHPQKDVHQYQRQKILNFLREIDIYYNPSKIRWLSVHLNLLRRSSPVLDRFFRFPQKNLESNSHMALIKI